MDKSGKILWSVVGNVLVALDGTRYQVMHLLIDFCCFWTHVP